MHVRKKVDKVRQTIIWSLTKNVGLAPGDHGERISPPEIKKILISRPNHRLGNTLLITPLLQEVIDTFPQAQIDLFVKGKAASVLLRNYDNINRIIQLPGKPFKNLFRYLNGWITLRRQHYDLAINAAYHSSSGRLSTRFARSRYRCFGDPDEHTRSNRKDHEHAAKYPVYSLRSYLSMRGFPENKKPIAPLNLRLSASEIAGGRKLLNTLVADDKRTICLFTYATGEKCYSKSWWDEFYQRLTTGHSNYNIIEVLPVENISQLSFAIPAFYSRDVREIGSVIANTELFIGADSGMMHLASSVQTNTVGLFKITNPATFGPYNNKSVSIDTNTGNLDDWIRVIDNILVGSGLKDELHQQTGFS
jgi:ADP-heptose:LPS heptosyltransferase